MSMLLRYCSTARLLFCAALIVVAPLLGANCAMAAGTLAGTSVYNTSTAAYTDANNNAFNATSNTVSATVQNAPSLTVGAPGNKNITPAMIVVDTFTLMNTGNMTGAMTVAPDAAFTGSTAVGTTLLGYVLGAGCTIAVPCTLATLNTQPGMTSVIVGGTALVGVEYQVAVGASSLQTVITTLTATINYVSQAGAAAETSAAATGAPTDTVTTEARLDVQTSVVDPGSSGANIAWTIKANNGGGNPAVDLLSTKAVLTGTGTGGLAIFVNLPAFAAGSILTAAPTPTLSGATSGAAVTLYYNAAACSTHPTSGWTTYLATAYCLAVYVSGGTGGVELPSVPGNSIGGAGAVTTAQITLTFSTTQPTGAGSGAAGSVTLLASSAIGGTVWATGVIPIVGQGVSIGTADAATASVLSGIETNATPSSGTSPAGGASNLSSSQAFAAKIIGNYPFHATDATGSYPASPNNSGGAVSINLDFTALNVSCSSNGSAGVNGLPCTLGAGIIVVNTVMNEGNATDAQVKLTATPPTGWKVQLWNATGCTAFIGTGCALGSAITSLSADGTATSGVISIASLATVDYEAVYTATGNSATPFTIYDTTITAAGQNGAGTGADANDTHNDLIPGGVVQLTNGLTVTATGCSPTESAPPTVGGTSVCPGGTVSHTIAYANIIPAALVTHLGSEPAFAYNACYTALGALYITDDGAATYGGATPPNNWSTYTNGLQVAVTDTTSGTVITYHPSNSVTFSAAQTGFSARIGSSGYQLPPGGAGTVAYTTVVK